MINPEYEKVLETAESRRGFYRDLVKRLKKKKPKGLEEEIRRLHDEAFEEFDCLRCGNCCRIVGPKLSGNDVNRLGKALSMRPKEVEEHYLTDDEDGDTVFREHPCPFLLEDNSCLIYEHRPKACRDYPHTDFSGVAGLGKLLDLSLENSLYCPVVARVLEGLSKL